MRSSFSRRSNPRGGTFTDASATAKIVRTFIKKGESAIACDLISFAKVATKDQYEKPKDEFYDLMRPHLRALIVALAKTGVTFFECVCPNVFEEVDAALSGVRIGSSDGSDSIPCVCRRLMALFNSNPAGIYHCVALLVGSRPYI